MCIAFSTLVVKLSMINNNSSSSISSLMLGPNDRSAGMRIPRERRDGLCSSVGGSIGADDFGENDISIGRLSDLDVLAIGAEPLGEAGVSDR